MPLTIITGASGQDGTYLSQLLHIEGGQVIGVVRPGSTARLFSGVERIECDISAPGAMESLIRTYRPDYFYNLAAESFSPACMDRPMAVCDLMSRSVVELLEAVRLCHLKTRVFQASSSEMFGVPPSAPQDESTPFSPQTIYGAAKTFAHHMCGFYRERFDIFVSCGILFSHESPLRRGNFLSKKVCQGAARISAGLQQELRLGDLSGMRDWSHARDMVRGMHLALQAPIPQDYVFASGIAHSVSDFCAVAFARVGLNWQEHVVVDPGLVRKESRVIVGNPDRARRELGWRIETSFVDMVHELVDTEMTELGASST